MLEERDWVMRLVKQLAQVLARVMRLSREKPEEAMEAVRDGSTSLLGVDFSTLLTMRVEEAAALLRDDEKLMVLAALLSAAGDVERARGNEGLAKSRWLHAEEVTQFLLSRKPNHIDALALSKHLHDTLFDS